ncbi:methyltransferase domain-containing protein [Leptospira santarosai]|uniref:methyltransferase domain-containing protein n=1 Tax=Leptospira santarosai TaxID=28183 RepID=UPI00211660DF|nr:methyltransferase domain-containing protein [Leptospira santarosai]
MNIINIPNQIRLCPCCLSQDFESLWSYEYDTKTLTKNWHFNIHNVICRECGFVFVSPAPDSQILLQYYEDSFSTFTSQPLDYDYEKRLYVIKKYVGGNRGVFLELGANQKTKFHSELEKIYSNVYTVEPNLSSKNEFRSLEALADIQTDCVASYFVLEHIPDIAGFWMQSAKLLIENGFLICEVPTIELYSKYLSPLIAFEHVNHFTIGTLANIANNYGFELVYSSHEDCSRPYGFVAVFQKKKGLDFKFRSEYKENKLFFSKGMDLVTDFFLRIEKASELITKAEKLNELVIVYAANQTTRRLFPLLKESKNVVVVDLDPRKENFFDYEIKVYQPNQLKDKFFLAEYIILCTERHAEAILSSEK